MYAVGSLDDDTLTVVTETITGIGTAPTAVNTGNTLVDDDQTGWSAVATVAILGGIALFTLGFGARRLQRVRAR